MNPPDRTTSTRLAEQQIPCSAVLMHGVLAFGTVLFVVLSALFVADSS